MRRIYLVPLVMMTLMGLAGSQAVAAEQTSAAEKSKAQVLEVDAAVNRALQNNDTAALSRLWADGLVFTTHTGQQLTKTQILNLFRSKTVVVNKLRHEDIRVHMYGNTAVLTGRTVSELTYNGKHIAPLRAFTNVYVKQNGRWRTVVHDETPVLKP
ncbi:MAG: nuclear transport factor 2 family protein [Candidatus Acidiferrales bacterium]